MIEIREAVTSGFGSLRVHALRSFLAMLGIIFGVGAGIAMLSIGAGAEREALATLESLGLRNVLVVAKDPERESERQELRRKSLGLAPRDAVAKRVTFNELENQCARRTRFFEAVDRADIRMLQ